MATWGEFQTERGEMAAVLTSLLNWIPIVYLATVRKDGAPRLHPVCPVIADGRIFIAVPETSPKRLDLHRDGRYALHALPDKRDDEFYVTGTDKRAEDDATRELVSGAAGHHIRASDWLFELHIDHAMTAYWEKQGQPATYAVREMWRRSSLRVVVEPLKAGDLTVEAVRRKNTVRPPPSASQASAARAPAAHRAHPSPARSRLAAARR